MHPSVMWNVCSCVGVVSCVTCTSAWVCVSITSTDAYYNGSANAVFTLYFGIVAIFLDTLILTLSDYFSKWVEAVATPSKEAHQVASTL